MITYQVQLLDRSVELKQGPLGRPTSVSVCTFGFRLVPIDTVGLPDEDSFAEERSILVTTSIEKRTTLTSNNPGMPDAFDRMLYWVARSALADGKTEVRFLSGDPTPKVDLSRINPQEPFVLDLPGPAMGFHVRG